MAKRVTKQAQPSEANSGQPTVAATTDVLDAPAEWVDPARLTPWSKNPKPIAAKDVREMGRSIRRFGFGAPIVARRANGEVIEGHLRLAAALRLKLDRVPVRYLDLPEDEAHLLAVAAIKFEHRRETDDDALAGILDDLEEKGVDLTVGTGYEDEEIDALLDAVTDDDAVDSVATPGPEQVFGPATAEEQGRLDVKMRQVACPKCRHEFLA